MKLINRMRQLKLALNCKRYFKSYQAEPFVSFQLHFTLKIRALDKKL